VPLQLATMFLGLAPDVPAGTVELAPRLPDGIEALEVDGIRLPGGRLSLRVERSGGTRVLEAPAGLSLTLRT
jgi:hypothetical protein